MAESAAEGNAMLSIRNSHKLESYIIERIAEDGKQHVTFK